MQLTCDQLADAQGTDLGTSSWVVVTQEQINQFAEATLDQQWIHTDPERAASGPFGVTIAHGYLTLSLVSHFIQQLLVVPDASMGVNYGLNRVRFPAPVPVGSRVRGRGTLQQVDRIDGGVQTLTLMEVECEGSAKPVVVAEVLSRFLA
jgi:acyl dehydratase